MENNYINKGIMPFATNDRVFGDIHIIHNYSKKGSRFPVVFIGYSTRCKRFYLFKYVTSDYKEYVEYAIAKVDNETIYEIMESNVYEYIYDHINKIGLYVADRYFQDIELCDIPYLYSVNGLMEEDKEYDLKLPYETFYKIVKANIENKNDNE